MTILDVVITGKDDATATFKSVDSSLGKLGGTAGKVVAGGMAIAATAVVAVGAAAVAAGAAALNLSTDIDNATNNIAAKMGMSKDEAAGFEDVMTGIFANNFGDSFEDIGAAIVTVSQSLGDMPDAALQGIAEDAFALRDAFEVDVTESVTGAKALMEAFGISGEQSMDFIASGMQNGLNASDDFIESIGEYSNLFAEAGFSADEMYNIMESGAQAGILGTDKIADAVKEMGIKLNEGTDETKEAFDSIGLSFDDIAGSIASGDETWADYFDNIVGGLNEIEDPMERSKAQVAIFGTMAEDLGASFTEGLSAAGVALEDMSGATEALNAQYDNWPSMWEGVKRNALLALQPLGDVLLNIGNQIMPIVQDAFETIGAVAGPIIEEIAELISGSEDPFGNLANIVFYLSEAFGISSEAMQPFFDALVKVRNIFWDILPAIEIFKQHLESGNGLIIAFTALLGDVLMAFGLTGEEASKFTIKFYEITTAIKDAVAPIIAFVKENLKLKDILVVVGAIIAGVVINALIGFVAAIAPVIAVIAVAIAAITLMRKAWETDFAGIRDFVAGVWDAITQVWDAFKKLFEGDFKGFLTTIGEAWETAWSAVVEFLGNLWDMAKPHLEALWRAFTAWFAAQDWAQIGRDIVMFITDALKTFVAFIGPILAGWWGAFTSWVAGVPWKDIAVTIINAILAGLSTFENFVGAKLAEWYQAFLDWASEAVTWENIGKLVAEAILLGLAAWQKLDEVLEAGWNAMLGWFTSQPWDEHGDTVSTGIKEGLERLWETISGAFDAMWTEIKSWFTEPGKFEALGHSIMDGLKAGIEAKVEAVKQVMRDFLAGFNQVFQEEEDSGSPSMVWWSFGRDLMTGLALGIVDNASVPTQAIEDFIDDIDLMAMAKIVEKLAQAVTAVANSIRPAIQAINDIMATTFVSEANFVRQMDQLKQQVNIMVTWFARLGWELTSGNLGKAEDMTKAATTIADAIGSIIAALQVIAAENIPRGLGDKYQVLVNEAQYLTLLFSVAAATLEEDTFPQIIAYIAAATAVFGLVELAVKSMQFLSDVDFGPVLKDGFHLRDQMIIFRNIVRSTMREFDTAAQEIDAEMSDAVSALADAAGSVFEIIELVIEKAAFLSDTDFSAILKDGYYLHDQVVIFRNIVRDTMRQFAEAAGEMKTEGLAAIQEYVDAASAVFGLVEIALETVAQIGDYVGIEDIAAKVTAFADDVQAITTSLADAFKLNRREGNLVKVAARFAEEIAAVMALVIPAVDALVALADYEGFGSLNDAIDKVKTFERDFNVFIESFVAAMWLIVFKSGSLIEATHAFGPKLQSIIGVVLPAIDALAGVASHESLGSFQEATDKVKSFERDFNIFIESFVAAMWLIVFKSGSLITATHEFAAKITTILSVIRPAIDGLASIAEYKSVQDLGAKITKFTDQLSIGIDTLVTDLNEMAGLVDATEVETASNFATSIEAIMRNVQSIFSSLSDMANTDMPGGLKGILTDMIAVLRSAIPDAALAGYDFGLAWINGVREAIGAMSLDMGGGGTSSPLAGAASGAAMSGGLTTNLNVDMTLNATINNDMDAEEFMFRVTEAIRSMVT